MQEFAALGAFSLAFVLAIVWTIIPFVIFSIRKTLRQTLAEQQQLNRELQALRGEVLALHQTMAANRQ
jgi:membrane protein implicated in regulation of membrane protease activity